MAAPDYGEGWAFQDLIDAYNELELVDGIDHSRPLFHQIRELRERLRRVESNGAE